MTKEELKQEAEEWIKDHSGLIGSYEFVKYDYDSMQKAYLASAEPREKRIAELEKENAELEAQIERMKNCKNCKKLKKEKDGLLFCTVGSIYTNIFGKNCDKWEIKEND